MLRDVRRGGMLRAERGGEEEPDLVLLEQVRGPVAGSRLRPSVGDQLKTEGGPVIVAGLLGISDVELDEVGAVDWKAIGGCCVRSQGLGVHDSSGMLPRSAVALTERYLWA